MAALSRGMPRAGWLALLLHALLGRCVAGDDCSALNERMAHMNGDPGFWAPSVVFRAQQVRPGAIHPPNKTHQTRDVKLVGACEAALLRADAFEWQKPTSDGGDWIATTRAAPMQINIDSTACPLTGIALTTLGWPSLRLQFEQCTRKTAVEVPLTNSSSNGMKLVHWLCKVAIDSQLCAEAAELLPAGQGTRSWSDQVFLDLSPLTAAASHGLSRMQIYSECYENLDWFIVNAPISVDESEWQMVQAIMKVLAPPEPNPVHIKSNVVVETLCMPDCNGNMDDKCHATATVPAAGPAAGPVAAAAPVVIADSDNSSASEESLAESFEAFTDSFTDKEVQPWLLAFCGVFLLIGSLFAWCCVSYCNAAPAAPLKTDRKIKKVAVVYHEVPEESQSFFTQ